MAKVNQGLLVISNKNFIFACTNRKKANVKNEIANIVWETSAFAAHQVRRELFVGVGTAKER